jgi:hypothetical protein
MSKRDIRQTLKEAGISWQGFYSLRRFHATPVRMESKSGETAAKAMGNTKDVCGRHHIKSIAGLPDVREAVDSAMRGLATEQGHSDRHVVAQRSFLHNSREL